MSTGWQLGQEFRRNLTKSTALESPSDDCKMAARVTHRVPKHRLVHLNHVHSRSTLGIVTAAAPRTPVQCWGEPEASGAKGCRRSRDATHRCVHAHARRHTHTQAHTRMHAHAHTRRHTHARTHAHTHARTPRHEPILPGSECSRHKRYGLMQEQVQARPQPAAHKKHPHVRHAGCMGKGGARTRRENGPSTLVSSRRLLGFDDATGQGAECTPANPILGHLNSQRRGKRGADNRTASPPRPPLAHNQHHLAPHPRLLPPNQTISSPKPPQPPLQSRNINTGKEMGRGSMHDTSTS